MDEVVHLGFIYMGFALLQSYKRLSLRDSKIKRGKIGWWLEALYRA